VLKSRVQSAGFGGNDWRLTASSLMRRNLFVGVALLIHGAWSAVSLTAEPAKPKAEFYAAIDAMSSAFCPPPEKSDARFDARKKLEELQKSADKDTADVCEFGLDVLTAGEKAEKEAENYAASSQTFNMELTQDLDIASAVELNQEIFGGGGGTRNNAQKLIEKHKPAFKDMLAAQTKSIEADIVLDNKVAALCAAIRKKTTSQPKELKDINRICRATFALNASDKTVRVQLSNPSGKTYKNCIVLLDVDCACDVIDSKEMETEFGSGFVDSFVSEKVAGDLAADFEKRDKARTKLFQERKSTVGFKASWEPKKLFELSLMSVPAFIKCATNLRLTMVADTSTGRAALTTTMQLDKQKTALKGQWESLRKQQRAAIMQKAMKELEKQLGDQLKELQGR
jgi:hypothetical protein